MNFLQYCLATKNYSAIDAVRCYAKNKSNVGKYVATGLGAAALTGAPLGYLLNESNKDRDAAKGERDTAVKDKETAVAAQKAAEQERDTAKSESNEWHDKADEFKQAWDYTREQNEALQSQNDAFRDLHTKLTKNPAFKVFEDKGQAQRWIQKQVDNGNPKAFDYKIYHNTQDDGDPGNDYQVVDVSQFYRDN